MSYVHKNLSRRAMLQALTGAAMVTGTSFGTTLSSFMTASAQTAGDYKALVCLYLFGGNDHSNTVLPREGAAYQSYRSARPALALDSATLLPISPGGGYSGPALGLHPSLTNIQGMFAGGRAAILANVGPLAYPLTLAQYEARSVATPFQLFSHSDQDSAWQTGIPDGPSRTGWLGRMSDFVRPTFNPNGILSPNISVAGNAVILSGLETIQYQMSSRGPMAIEALSDDQGLNYSQIAQTQYRAMVTGARSHLMENGYNAVVARADRIAREAGGLIAATPTFETVFAEGNSLGSQLRMVARTIAARTGLQQSRQIFFVSAGGWDFHDNLLEDQAERLRFIDTAIGNFFTALQQINIADRVTLFTASDFGRGLQSNGRGSDHGWGGHHFILGGAVRGGRIYGTWPSYELGGPEDVGQGRLLPGVSVDQYAATLARWFGLSSFELNTVLPNLGRFSNQDLGFMNT
jgi:uncharacterized protein (DUF1501 family)